MSVLHELERLGYQVDEAGNVVSVRGFGVAIVLEAAGADTASARDALAEPAAHAERRFQFLHPKAAAARAALEAAGYTISPVDPSADVFTVTPPATGPLSTAAQEATPDQLTVLAEAHLDSLPPLPTQRLGGQP